MSVETIQSNIIMSNTATSLNQKVSSLFAKPVSLGTNRRKSWCFRGARDRNPPLSYAGQTVRIRSVGVGSNLYRIGNYAPADLDAVKQHARQYGAIALTMGNVRIAL